METQASDTSVDTRRSSSRPTRHFAARLGGFVWWILTGFGLLTHLRGTSRHFKLDEVVAYSVHRAFFLWPLIAIGFVGAAMIHHRAGTAAVWGWIYVWALLYTFVTLLFDAGAIKILLWSVVFGFLWTASKYVEDVKGVPVLSGLFRYFRQLHPQLDPGFATSVSWLLLAMWLGALFHSFSRGRKTFSPNGIEEWFLGEGCEITDRAGLKFRSHYRDLFETVLGFGAGDLEAIDGTGRVVKRWENVMFLFFIWKRLDEILHQRAAVVDNAPENPVEVESSRRRLAKEEMAK